MLTGLAENSGAMQAVILHAEGDELVAAGVAAKLAPAEAVCARLRADSGSAWSEDAVFFALWSANADAAALAQALTRVAARAAGRCVVVRADGTPLPPLPTGARLIPSTAAAVEFAHTLSAVRAAAPPQTPPARARAVIGGWTPGISIGLAIYSGMFVVAGAWRSEEVSEAIENGRAVPLAVGLHSFQTAAVAGVARVQVALAGTTPSASFVQPQRVILTGTIDSATMPVVSEAPVLRGSSDDFIPAPVRLQPVDASLAAAPAFAPAAGAPLDASYGAFDPAPLLDVGLNEF